MRTIIGYISYFSEDWIARSVKSLVRSDPESPAICVVVVDNSGTWPELTTLEGIELEILRPATNIGYAGGANRLIDHARRSGAAHLLILNPDTIAISPLVARLTEVLVVSGADIATCKIAHGDEQVLWYGGGEFSRRSGRTSHALYGAPLLASVPSFWRPTDWASGACMMLSSSFLALCPPFDERFFLYLEELEWQLRARATVVVGDFVGIRHYEGTSVGKEWRLDALPSFFMARNRLLLRASMKAPRVPWLLRWIYDFIARPIRVRSWQNVRAALAGARCRGLAGPDALRAFLVRYSDR